MTRRSSPTEPKRTLVVPASLAYGETGAGASIPPDSDLVFETELVGIATGVAWLWWEWDHLVLLKPSAAPWQLRSLGRPKEGGRKSGSRGALAAFHQQDAADWGERGTQGGARGGEGAAGLAPGQLLGLVRTRCAQRRRLTRLLEAPRIVAHTRSWQDGVCVAREQQRRHGRPN